MVFTSLAWLYDITEHRKSQPVHYKNVVQKNAADFMQIDETDILIYIVYNIWTMTKVYYAVKRRSEPFSGKGVFLYV